MDLFHLTVYSQSIMKWGYLQVQKLRQRLWGNTAYWLAPQGLFSLLLYRIQDPLPRNVTTPSGLGPSTLIIKEDIGPKARPRAELSHPRVPLPR